MGGKININHPNFQTTNVPRNVDRNAVRHHHCCTAMPHQPNSRNSVPGTQHNLSWHKGARSTWQTHLFHTSHTNPHRTLYILLSFGASYINAFAICELKSCVAKTSSSCVRVVSSRLYFDCALPKGTHNIHIVEVMVHNTRSSAIWTMLQHRLNDWLTG